MLILNTLKERLQDIPKFQQMLTRVYFYISQYFAIKEMNAYVFMPNFHSETVKWGKTCFIDVLYPAKNVQDLPLAELWKHDICRETYLNM